MTSNSLVPSGQHVEQIHVNIPSTLTEWRACFEDMTQRLAERQQEKREKFSELRELHRVVTVRHERDIDPVRVESLRDELEDDEQPILEAFASVLWRDESAHAASGGQVLGRFDQMARTMGIALDDGAVQGMLAHVMSLKPSCYALESACWKLEEKSKWPTIGAMKEEIREQEELWKKRLDLPWVPEVRRYAREILETLKTPKPKPLTQAEIRERLENDRRERNERARKHDEYLARLERDYRKNRARLAEMKREREREAAQRLFEETGESYPGEYHDANGNYKGPCT